MPRVYAITPEVDRFWTRVDKGAEGECWHWTGGMLPNGYGRFCLAKANGGRTVLAHRYSYELAIGPVPPGLDVDHTCHNADAACAGGFNCQHRACVNPSHLEAVTRRTNTLRGRAPTAENAAKTHCPKGHPYNGVRNNGSRFCRTCLNAWHRNRRSA